MSQIFASLDDPRPIVILPGYLAAASDYSGMAAALVALGWPSVTVVPLTRQDWLPTLGGRSIRPILAKLDETVQAVRSETGRDRIDLVAHSAGGWIARIYLGDRPYDIHASDAGQRTVWAGRTGVRSLVCLGTPQDSQERWTRRNLQFTNESYPGAYYAVAPSPSPDPTPGPSHSDQPAAGSVRYLCVAGRAVFGQTLIQLASQRLTQAFGPKSGRELGRELNQARSPQAGQWLAYQSYQLTCGDGNTWGDGITPIVSAHLVGAENFTLEGVWHSPRSPGGVWYGSGAIVAQWARFLAREYLKPSPTTIQL